MSTNWSHPCLGTLEHDDIVWRRVIGIPSFESFTYINACSKPVLKKMSEAELATYRMPFELVLHCQSEDEEPDEPPSAGGSRQDLRVCPRFAHRRFSSRCTRIWWSVNEV